MNESDGLKKTAKRVYVNVMIQRALSQDKFSLSCSFDLSMCREHILERDSKSIQQPVGVVLGWTEIWFFPDISSILSHSSSSLSS